MHSLKPYINIIVIVFHLCLFSVSFTRIPLTLHWVASPISSPIILCCSGLPNLWLINCVYNTYYSGSLVVGTTIRLTNQDLSVIPQLPGPQNSQQNASKLLAQGSKLQVLFEEGEILFVTRREE